MRVLTPVVPISASLPAVSVATAVAAGPRRQGWLARVVPVVTRMTEAGYDIEVHAPLADFPGDDVVQDTVRMNRLLGDWVRTMPEQYYWVHKRLKTRPEGEPGLY